MSWFKGNYEYIGAGGELTLAQELWILNNSGKDFIESDPSQAAEKRITNIIATPSDQSIIVTHQD